MKSLWQWEKHNIVNYLKANMSETEEFTNVSLIKKITKCHYYGYSDRIISKHLSDLVIEGYLKVRYISVKMEPDYENRNYGYKFGSKTVSVYTINKEKI